MMIIDRGARIRFCVGSLLAVLLVASPATACDPPDAAGAWGVGHTAFTVVDAARADRPLPLNLWYPVDDEDWAGVDTVYVLSGFLPMDSELAQENAPVSNAGARPLIVFSHGYGGLGLQSVRLMEHLASHGFIVVSPDHTGNTQDDQSSPDPEADRYPDIAFIIDEMELYNTTPGNEFFGRVDTQNVGVAGHSYGGMTSLFMAAGHAPYPPDTRVKAIMPIAPSTNQLTDPELASITIPTLFLVGTLDDLQDETVHAIGLVSSAPALFHVDVVGANHTHFANVCDIGNALIAIGIAKENWGSIGAGELIPIYDATCIPPAFSIEEATRIQNLYAAAHFRKYLLGEIYYDRYLTADYANGREPDVGFFGGIDATVDPFLCYKSKTTQGADKLVLNDVSLTDAFATGVFKTKKGKALCVPADVDVAGVADSCTNLRYYKIKGPKDGSESPITVTDQFGTLTLETGKAALLLTPAAISLTEDASPPGDSLDSYKCHKAKVSSGTRKLPKGMQTSVVDRFEDRLYDVKKPAHLCVAADKDAGGIVNAVDYLVCYKVKRAKEENKHVPVRDQISAQDSFGLEQLDTITEKELCVPARATP